MDEAPDKPSRGNIPKEARSKVQGRAPAGISRIRSQKQNEHE